MSVLNTRSHLPIILNGKHYEIDLTSFRRTTVEAMRTQNDLNSEATEQTLNTVYVWKRTGADFRLGAGQYWFDVYDGSNRRRFHESLHVNPWAEHELSLLNTTSVKVAASTYPYKGSWLFTIQDNLIFVRNVASSSGANSGFQIYNIPDPTVSTWTVGSTMIRVGGSGDTFSFVSGGSETTSAAGYITSLVSNGLNLYFTHSTNLGVREHGVFQMYKNTSGSWVYERLGVAANDYDELLLAGPYVLARHIDTTKDNLVQIKKSSHQIIASYETNAMPHFTASVLGPDGVYLSATDPINSSSSTYGLTSTIYRCAIDTTTTAGSLLPPAPVASLPLGEVINTMVSYAGYLLIGTSKGFRLGTFLNTGGISFGPVVVLENYLEQIAGTTATATFNATDSTFHGGVTSFEPKGQYVWFNWNRYLTTDNQDYCGVGRINLGQLVDDLQPAYASDLMITNTFGSASEVQAIVNYKDKLYFSTAGAGVFAETSTRKTYGWLRTGKINYGTTEKKQFIRVDLEGANYDETSTGTDIAVKFVGDASDLGSLNSNGFTTPIDGRSGEYQELEFVWNGSSNSSNAKLNKWTLRSVPVPERQEEIYLPIIIKDAVSHNYAFSVGMDPYTDFSELNALMKSRSIIELTIGDETRNVFIDSITTGEQQGVDVERWNRNESWLEGVWHVKCITVDQTDSSIAPIIYAGPPVTIGSVSTLTAGSSATVTNSGTSHYPVLDFGLPQGATGITGDTGTAATIAVGTTTTGSAGSSATVNNSGNSTTAIFDFTIPTGATGPANTLSIGTVTTVATGGSATASISGTAPSQTLNLGIPRGATGFTGNMVRSGSGAPSSSLGVDGDFYIDYAASRLYGPRVSGSWGSGVALIGASGTAATISTATPTTITGAAGTSASVTNTGTTSNAIYQFTIPRGDTGPSNSLSIGTVTSVITGGSATASISGTAPTQTLNLGLPIGATGAAGDWSTAQPNRLWSTRTTLTSADSGYLILVDSATAISVTSTTALTTGQRIDFLITNATVPTISAGTGATLDGTPKVSGAVKFRAQYSAATLICTSGASQSYVLVGDLAAA